MGTQLATQEINMDELKRMGMMFALSGFFDTNGPPEVAVAQMSVKVLAGQEIGFGPFAAVNGIHIIKGKPSISANIMAAAVKSHPGYDYRVRIMTDKEVAIDFFEIVDGKREKIGTSEFTAADAAKAGTQNMGKFPRNMLFARAMSNGVRWYAPDVFSGNTVYTPEELGARTDDDGYIIVDRQSGEVIESPRLSAPAPAKKTEPAPAIESLDNVEELDFDGPPSANDEFDAIKGPAKGQTASVHTAQQSTQPVAQPTNGQPASRNKMHAILSQMDGGIADKEGFRHFLVGKWSNGEYSTTTKLDDEDVVTFVEWLEQLKKNRLTDYKLSELRAEFQPA